MRAPSLIRLIITAAVVATLAACGPAKHVVAPPTQTPVATDGRRLTPKEEHAVVKEARRWIGTPYQRGGHSLAGTDCSGMVMEVYRKACDIKLPRSSREQQRFCRNVNRRDLHEGDLVFFATGSTGDVSHVGLYIGNGEIIHASSSRGVMVSRLDEKYFQRTYHSSGRVLATAALAVAKEAVAKEVTPKPTTIDPAPALILDEVIDQKIDSIYSQMFD